MGFGLPFVVLFLGMLLYWLRHRGEEMAV